MASRRRFTKEFKQEAVRLVLEQRVTMSQVARGRRGDGCVGLSGAMRAFTTRCSTSVTCGVMCV